MELRAIAARLPHPVKRRLRATAAHLVPATSPSPWDLTYLLRREKFITKVLDDPTMIDRFARRESLPAGYGVGLDERCVEYPWLMAHNPHGALLDAGSTLNHDFVLERILPRLEHLHIVTLAYEGVAFPERNVSYVYGDLRALPYQDKYFDQVASLSTLEHVGLDNSRYGGKVESDNAAQERRRALRELRRVTRPGGHVLITVPYGLSENLGWLEQLNRADVEDLASEFAASEVTIYRYDVEEGWQLSSYDAAGDTRFGAPAAAAGAVACIAAIA